MNLARLALVISALSAPVAAQDYHVGQIAITRPVLRVASPVSKTGAGYMTISNSGLRAAVCDAMRSSKSTLAKNSKKLKESKGMQMDRTKYRQV